MAPPKIRTEEYYKEYRLNWQRANRERLRIYRKKHYDENPEAHARWSRTWREKIRDETIAAYGGVCVCCGESTKEFLTIDHVNGGGTKERGTLKRQGAQFYNWLKRQDFPKEDYRLLCMNCNFSLGLRGYCPHQNKLKVN